MGVYWTWLVFEKRTDIVPSAVDVSTAERS